MRAPIAALMLMGCASSDDTRAQPSYALPGGDPPRYASIQQVEGRLGACVQLDHDGALAGARFFDHGRRVVTWSFDGTARTWDSRSGRPFIVVRQNASILEALLTRDETRLITSGHDGTARVWDVATGEQMSPKLQHTDWVRDLVLSPDESLLATSSQDHTTKIWNMSTGAQNGTTLQHDGIVWGARFSRDGTQVLTWAIGAARLWDTRTGQLLLDLPHDESTSVDGAIFFAEETKILTWGFDGTARVWDASSGTQILAMPHEASVSGAVLSQDERRLLTWGAAQDSIKLWDIFTGDRVIEFGRGEQRSVGGAAFFNDQRRVLTWAYDDTARVWDISTGQALAPPMRSDDQVLGAALSPDETHVLTWSRDWTARLFSVSTGEQIGPSMEHFGSVDFAYFSADGDRILTTSSDHSARVWQLSELAQLQRSTEEQRVDWRCQPNSPRRGRRVLVY